jgi:hypothetical protein
MPTANPKYHLINSLKEEGTSQGMWVINKVLVN